MNKLKHSNLKKLANEANSLLASSDDHLKRWYELVIDAFLTKTYKSVEVKPKKAPKYTLPIYFHNKGLEMIELNKILRKHNVLTKLSTILSTEESPSIVYSLSFTIRNKLFNYKETIDNIDISDIFTFGASFPECDCHNPDFCVPDYGHIVTGDLRFIKNQHLRKLISKGPNYRVYSL